jgi:hypothetical protein
MLRSYAGDEESYLDHFRVFEVGLEWVTYPGIGMNFWLSYDV